MLNASKTKPIPIALIATPTPLNPCAKDLVDFSVLSTPFSIFFILSVASLPKTSRKKTDK